MYEEVKKDLCQRSFVRMEELYALMNENDHS